MGHMGPEVTGLIMAAHHVCVNTFFNCYCIFVLIIFKK